MKLKDFTNTWHEETLRKGGEESLEEAPGNYPLLLVCPIDCSCTEDYNPQQFYQLLEPAGGVRTHS